MLESPNGNRRAMLMLLGSAMAIASSWLLLPMQSIPNVLRRLPDSLSLLASRDVCRQARRRMRVQSCTLQTYEAVQAYVRAPDNQVTLAHFKHQVRQEFITGRITVVEGWVVAETELALLALVKR